MAPLDEQNVVKLSPAGRLSLFDNLTHISPVALTAVAKGRGMAVVVVLTRSYGLEALGTYVLAQTIIALVRLVAGSSIGTAIVVQWNTLNESERASTIGAVIAAGVVCCAVLAGLWHISVATLGLGIPLDLHGGAILAGYCVIPLTLINLVANCYRAHDKVGQFSIIRAAESGVEVVCLTSAAVIGASFAWASGAVLLGTSLLAVHCHRGARYRSLYILSSMFLLWDRSKLLLAEALRIAIIGAAFLLIDRADRVIIAGHLSTADVGIYSAGYALASFVYTLIGPLNTGFAAHFRDDLNGGSTLAVQRFRRYAGGALALVVASFIAVLALREPASRLILGTGDADAMSKLSEVAVLLSAAGIAYGASQVISFYHIVTRRSRVLVKPTVLVAVIGIASSYFFIGWWGLHGAAWSSAMIYLSLLVVYIRTLPAELSAAGYCVLMTVSLPLAITWLVVP